jgi:hypothetical protein
LFFCPNPEFSLGQKQPFAKSNRPLFYSPMGEQVIPTLLGAREKDVHRSEDEKKYFLYDCEEFV